MGTVARIVKLLKMGEDNDSLVGATICDRCVADAVEIVLAHRGAPPSA